MLFVGTPCQVSAVLNTFGKKYREQLFLIDFACHGVPSQLFFDLCIKHEEKKNNCKIIEFNFRKRHNGFPHGYSYTYEKNGKTKVKKGIRYDFPYYQAFCEYASLRECCYSCDYSTKERVSDLTLGDFWRLDKYYKKDPWKGISFLIPNTSKGQQLMSILSENIFFGMPLNEYNDNPSLYEPTKKPVLKREKYINELKKNFDEIEKIVLPDNLRKLKIWYSTPYFVQKTYVFLKRKK